MTLSHRNSQIEYGGAYKRYMELMDGMLAAGWRVHHISPRGFSNISHANLYHHGVYRIPFRPAYLPFILQAIPQATSVARKHGVDALIAFTMFDAFIGIVVRLFNSRVKVVMCDRGSPLAGLEIRLREKYRASFLVPLVIPILSFFQRCIYNKADLAIFNSDARRKQMMGEAKLKPEKTKLVYNNANPSWVLEKIEEAHREAPKIRERYRGRKLVMFVGNLFIDGRDISTLLKAFQKVREEMPEALLLLVGEGPDKREILRLRDALGLQDDVILEGWKDNPLSYMLASDVLLVLALHESCSNTILEALYCGVLTIGSKVGGIAETLKYDELLFPPKDDKILAEKILSFLNNREKREMALRLVGERRTGFIFNWKEEMLGAIQGVVP